jgi:hypothetical protein
MASRSPSPEATPKTDLSGNKIQKPNNGWTREQEELMAGWSDIAACYRWMHDRCEKIMARSNKCITTPVIILSTLTGSANFIVSSLTGDNVEMGKMAQIAIGGVSIFTAILQTLGNDYRFAQQSEAHRVASIAWGKFQRQLAVELALHPKERIECMDFLKICRAELDRLIEQSPPIPDKVIKAFEEEFKGIPDLKKPDIAHGMDHTRVFRDNDTRLKKIAADAAVMIKQRRKVWHDAMMPAVDTLVDKKLSKMVTDLSGTYLRTLQERVIELEKIVEEKNKSSIRNGPGGAHLRSFMRDIGNPLTQPIPNTGRRLSLIEKQGKLQIRSSTSEPRIRLPTPPTPLIEKKVDITIPGTTHTSGDDLIAALTEPRMIPKINSKATIEVVIENEKK